MDFKATENLSQILMSVFAQHAGGHDEDYGLYRLVEYLQAEDHLESLATFDWDDGGDLDELMIDRKGHLFFCPTDGETSPIQSLGTVDIVHIGDVIDALKELLEAA